MFRVSRASSLACGFSDPSAYVMSPQKLPHRQTGISYRPNTFAMSVVLGITRKHLEFKGSPNVNEIGSA